jgi:ankyrin repeat protein
MPPLIYATEQGDIETVKALVGAGADINAGNSRSGLSPIFLAATGPTDVLLWMLEHGGDPNRARRDGVTPLMMAGSAGATDNVKALLDWGADVNARNDRGTALMSAAGSDRADFTTVKLLIDYGADTTIVGQRCYRCIHEPQAEDGSKDLTALMLARQRGDTDIVKLLVAAGAETATGRDRGPAAIRAAVTKSIALLQASGHTWIERAGCVSCHHQSIPALTFALAKQRGFDIDATMTRERVDATLTRWGAQREMLMQANTGAIVRGAHGAAYALFGLAADDVPPNATTDAIAHYLAGLQWSDGRFPGQNYMRPPLEDDDVTATALSIRTLQRYAAPGGQPHIAGIVKRARAWLLSTKPRGMEEMSFQLEGLAWSHADRGEIAKRAAAVVAEQRTDGGWGQFATLPSDAYATGQALVALHQAGGVDTASAVYQKGIKFLLDSQLADGSWLVKSRARGTQHFVDSGFPHGTNQFISAAGTAWATSALLLSLDPTPR